jgi:hypothetical protein
MAEVFVKVTVHADAKTEIAVMEGAAGVECENLTAGLEKALGVPKNRQHTEDYFKVKRQGQRLRS